ncbi:Retron-type RNA-directed DNA polymerase (EC [Halomonas sp. TD01]|nr:Retron-type RNA-directed DNA polymerase (EC [Halomonas sp. TD01]
MSDVGDTIFDIKGLFDNIDHELLRKALLSAPPRGRGQSAVG